MAPRGWGLTITQCRAFENSFDDDEEMLASSIGEHVMPALHCAEQSGDIEQSPAIKPQPPGSWGCYTAMHWDAASKLPAIWPGLRHGWLHNGSSCSACISLRPRHHNPDILQNRAGHRTLSVQSVWSQDLPLQSPCIQQKCTTAMHGQSQCYSQVCIDKTTISPQKATRAKLAMRQQLHFLLHAVRQVKGGPTTRSA